MGDSEDGTASSGQMDAMLPSLVRFCHTGSHLIEDGDGDVVIAQGSK